MCVLVVIGGGCTGTIQVNDTDLRQLLKRIERLDLPTEPPAPSLA